MKVQTFFEEKIVRFICDDKSIYENEVFQKNLEKFFNHPSVEKVTAAEQVGSGYTYRGLNKITPLMLPGAEKLEKWIYSKLIEAAPFFVNFKPSKITFHRIWTNRTFKGYSGKTHIHNENHGVGIFYLSVPKNSSDLVIVRNGLPLTNINDYDETDIAYANVTTGEFVLHKTHLMHGISEHKSEEPRICIVMDFNYHS